MDAYVDKANHSTAPECLEGTRMQLYVLFLASLKIVPCSCSQSAKVFEEVHRMDPHRQDGMRCCNVYWGHCC